MKTFEITLTRSLIGTKPNQRKTAHALGLKKINQTATHKENDAIKGMIKTISHLVSVVEK